MNKFVRGKTSLLVVSASMIVLCALCMVGTIALIVLGANVVKDLLVAGIVLIVIGAIMSLTFFSGVIYGFILYFTGKSLVALNNEKKEDNKEIKQEK